MLLIFLSHIILVNGLIIPAWTLDDPLPPFLLLVPTLFGKENCAHA